MGISLFKRCSSAGSSYDAPAPNPDPKRWKLLDVWKFENAYVLRVQYLDCINFEGIKVMVYQGKVVLPNGVDFLDPHFSENEGGPIARFRPDEYGIALACDFAETL